MKTLSIILAFVVLILSVQPVCASISSVDACCDTQRQSDCKQGQCDDSNSEQDCNSTCNPFQICACCPFSVVTPFQTSFQLFIYPTMQDVRWAVLSITCLDEPVSAFWQPPKIA